MPILHLTDIAVQRLKTVGTFYDDTTPAFGIRIGKNRKTWIIVRGKSRTRTRLGYYPALPLSEARKRAQAILSGVAPVLERSTKTFGEALPLFIEENYRGRKPKTKAEAKRLLMKHFKPLHPKNLAAVTDAEIGKELDKLKDRPGEQLHAFRAIRTFLRWCTKPPRRYITHSPLEGYDPPSKDKKGNRILTDDELVKVWRACEGQFGALVKLLILWGTRNGETARIKREWFTDNVLVIDGSVTKNGRAHAIPVLPLARSILDEQRNNSTYFFPGRDIEAHFHDGSWTKKKKELVKTSDVTKWQLRDLRRTFRSNMARLGVSREIAERLINHVTGIKNDLDEIYDRYDYLDEKRDALEKWEARITALLAR